MNISPHFSCQHQYAITGLIGLIEKGKSEATCLIDGSKCQVEGFPDGNWIGTTLFSGVKTESEIYKTEIFILSLSNTF